MKKIILFGCGSDLNIAYKSLSQEFKIVGFFDNNGNLTGRILKNITIDSPDNIHHYEFDLVYITSMYVNEIRKQLISLGIPFEKIKVFRKKSHRLNALIYLYPFYGFLPNIQRMFSTMWSCRVLINRKLNDFNRFTASHAINSLHYWNQNLNISRYGMSGTSPYLGTGNYSIGKWWFSSHLSLNLYHRYGSLMPLLCMTGWFLSHLLWLNIPDINYLFFVFVLSIVFFSSYFFGSCFVFLNYNAFGWMLFPIGLYSLFTSNFWLTTIVLLLTSLGSITVVFVFSFISLFHSIYIQSIFPIIALLPAIIFLSIKFFSTNDIKTSIFNVANSIGLYPNKKVKYKRSTKRSKVFDAKFLHFLSIWSLFYTILFFQSNQLTSHIFLSLLVLYFLNSTKLRFADVQSLYIAVFSAATMCIIENPNILLISVFWIGAFTSPNMIEAHSRKGSLLWPCGLKPFFIRNLINKTSEFLSEIPKESKVLCVFMDPVGKYEYIFDGYRTIYELVFYVANLKEILVYPDWWAVYENNTVDAKGFWGKSPNEVKQNIITWKADHILVYQESGSQIEDKWIQSGFTEKSSMDWNDLLNNDLDGERCWGKKPTPKWFLLKCP